MERSNEETEPSGDRETAIPLLISMLKKLDSNECVDRTNPLGLCPETTYPKSLKNPELRRYGGKDNSSDNKDQPGCDEEFPTSRSIEDEVNILMSGSGLLLNTPTEASSSHLTSDDFKQTDCENNEDYTGPVRTERSTDTHHHDFNTMTRTVRATSEPAGKTSESDEKPKNQRPISDPVFSHHMLDLYENATVDFWKLNHKAATISGCENLSNEFVVMEHDSSLSKRKEVKIKTTDLNTKLVERLKEKPNPEDKEDNSQSRMEVEVRQIPPTLPPKQRRYVLLQRQFTLKDFKLDLEPINLMDEIFTGSEWLPYLPQKTTNSMDHSEEDQRGRGQTGTNHNRLCDAPHDHGTAAEVNTHIHKKQLETDASIFGVPTSLVTYNANKQPVPESNTNIYSNIDDLFFTKHENPLTNPVALPLNFSAIKPSELLDNSALKSRIRLSKKRSHRPPKKRRKVEKIKTKFYTIPSVVLKKSPGPASSPLDTILHN